jgi:DNA polymerase/3'-5' exonuclease PolX
MKNEQLIALLSRFRVAYSILGETYREQAYSRAIEELEGLDDKLSPANVGAMLADSVIGKKIKSKIAEYLKTGKIAKLAEVEENPKLKVLLEFDRITGVSAGIANRWINEGIIDPNKPNARLQLKRAHEAGSVKLTNLQWYGLKYYDDLKLRIPRAEVARIGREVGQTLVACGADSYKIAGSYRRKYPDCGDVDIIAKTAAAIQERTIAAIKANKKCIAIVASGPAKVQFLYQSGVVRQVDIIFATPASYAAALLYFTGSWQFNESMRRHAKKMGYKLNQNGLYKGNEIVPGLVTELAIFKKLNMAFIVPKEREGYIL